MGFSGRLFWWVYARARVQIDWLLEPLWWRLCRWRSFQLRNMAQYHRRLYREASEGALISGTMILDPEVQLVLAKECDQFADLLDEDSEG